MVSVNFLYVAFVCIGAPLVLMLFLLRREARVTVGFMLIGMVCCLFAGEFNALLRDLLYGASFDTYRFTTTVSPISEEIIKALPVLFYGFAISDNRERLLTVSLALGIGFAILENSYMLVDAAAVRDAGLTYGWSLVRGFATGLMHGICTASVGYGVSFVRKRRKLFYTGTFGLLTAAIVYHATYNSLVQSRFLWIGFLLPMATYIPVVIILAKKAKK